MANEYYIGCDVGTGSVRAGVFSRSGEMISVHSHPIKMWRPETDFVEQSSDNIWQSTCRTIKSAVEKAGVKTEEIRGIGFDATCSLVVLDGKGDPIPVTPGEPEEQNVIVWMDHRSIDEAVEINRTQHEVLQYVGGTISPEMETPKLLWLKRNNRDTWSRAAKFFDLPDFLVYKATGEDVRSLCTTTCKWTYLAHEKPASGRGIGRWDDSYFREIGLGDLPEEAYQRIGHQVRPVGEAVGNGLSPEAAKSMGLLPSTPVAVAIIDAHAGGLGLLGMGAEETDGENSNFEDRIALIGGTSSCHMAVSREPKFVEGVWGPYFSAMIPGMWLTEGGQSATGALIDHIIFSSRKSIELEQAAEKRKTTVYEILNERVNALADKNNLAEPGRLTRDLHMLPYFHGNRSPRANPSLTGTVTGLTLSSTLDDLALLYLAAIQAIAYGTRHILETLNEHGYAIDKIMATGGGTKNELFLQQHADICGCRIVLPAESEAVLLGSAILGAVAGGAYSSVSEGMISMNRQGRIVQPFQGVISDYHKAKYEVFHKMYRDEISYIDLMKDY